MEESRVGFGFGNPDLDSDYYYPSWGRPVTPDEMRYIVLFGTRMVSSDQSQTYTDEMIHLYIDAAIGILERDLSIDIYPRMVRYDDPIDENTGKRVPRTDIPAGEANLVREPGYPYREGMSEHYMSVTLRRRPLQGVETAILYDPSLQAQMINLTAWRRERRGLASFVQFFPTRAVWSSFIYPFLYNRMGRFRYPFNNFPDAIRIDYKTGFPNANDVPRDMRNIIMLIAGITLLSDFGDGRTAGVASQSLSLNSISESYTSAMSATSGMYTERTIEYRKTIKEWYKRNESYYRRTVFGAFG